MIKNKKQAIQIMQKFVDGQIDTNQFWDFYKNNKIIKNILVKNMQDIDKIAYFNPLTVEKLFNKDNIFDKYELFEMIRRYLYRNSIPYTGKNKEFEIIQFIQDCQPKWLDIRNKNFWEKILSGIDITKPNNKKLIKEKILTIFKFDNQPPKWIQAPEWPLDNNLQPLKFIKQTSVNNNCVQYEFLDENTHEITTVEQFD